MCTVLADPGAEDMEGKPGCKRGTSDSGFGSTFEDCGCLPPAKQPKVAERGVVSVVPPAASKLQENEEDVIRHEIKEGKLSLPTWG